MTAPVAGRWTTPSYCTACHDRHMSGSGWCGCDCHRPPSLLAEAAASIAGPGWRRFAACRDADPDLFFPEAQPGTADYRAQVTQALAYCSGCPVRPECLASGSRAEHGIWGGLAEDERGKPGTAPGKAGYCGPGRHLMTPANTSPSGYCRACKREAGLRRRPPTGRGKGNSLIPRERGRDGKFISKEMAA